MFFAKKVRTKGELMYTGCAAGEVRGEVRVSASECAVGVLDRYCRLCGFVYPPEFMAFRIEQGLEVLSPSPFFVVVLPNGTANLSYEDITFSDVQKIRKYLEEKGLDMNNYPWMVIGKSLPSWNYYCRNELKICSIFTNEELTPAIKRELELFSLKPYEWNGGTERDIHRFNNLCYGGITACHNP